MTEFEQETLRHLDALTEAVERLETALGEHSREVKSVRTGLDELLRRPHPNVTSLLNRVKKTEGEVSEIDGKLLRLRTEVDELTSAVGGRSGP